MIRDVKGRRTEFPGPQSAHAPEFTTFPPAAGSEAANGGAQRVRGGGGGAWARPTARSSLGHREGRGGEWTLIPTWPHRPWADRPVWAYTWGARGARRGWDRPTGGAAPGAQAHKQWGPTEAWPLICRRSRLGQSPQAHLTGEVGAGEETGVRERLLVGLVVTRGSAHCLGPPPGSPVLSQLGVLGRKPPWPFVCLAEV